MNPMITQHEGTGSRGALPPELPPHPCKRLSRERYAEWCAIVNEELARRGLPPADDLPEWDGPR